MCWLCWNYGSVLFECVDIKDLWERKALLLHDHNMTILYKYTFIQIVFISVNARRQAKTGPPEVRARTNSRQRDSPRRRHEAGGGARRRLAAAVDR